MGPELAVARDELRGELDNLRAAAEWTLAEDDEHVALPVLDALYTFLWVHSWFDGAETFDRLARTAGFDADDPESTSAVALAAAMYWVAIGARLGYDQEAEELAARCLSVLRARNMEREVADCLCALGIMAVYRDVYPEAVAFLEEAAEIARAIGDELIESGALMDLGSPDSSWTTSKRRAGRSRLRTSSRRSWAARFCSRMPRASSASSPMPRSATATRFRFSCTWRRTTCSRPSVTSAERVTRSAARA